jgi:hypothetical protein
MENKGFFKGKVLGGLKRVVRELLFAVAKFVMIVTILPVIGVLMIGSTVYQFLSEIWKALTGHGDIAQDDRPFVIDVKVRRTSSESGKLLNITAEK